MKKIKLFYGSSTGNTEHAAELIRKEFGDEDLPALNIAEASSADFESADALILGISTWEDGQLQEDWEEFFPNLDQVELRGKKVALFGLGDAAGFSGEFVSALGLLNAKIKERGATVVGAWPAAGYSFDHSNALEGDQFVGLVLDEDNQPEKTPERIKSWVRVIKQELLKD